jgi:hypothetical protein
VIERARRSLVADRRTHRLAPDHACQAHFAHQSFHRAARDGKAFSHHLAPHLPHIVNREVLGKNTGDLRLEGEILAIPR